ncbi:putative aspartyl protease At4g16563 [Silene latifolia]|uniref:putative aspartyl protease At4g16563 n=1 Tax=Silene latifolia TaxID=37657 RepID=UPI003D77E220
MASTSYTQLFFLLFPLLLISSLTQSLHLPLTHSLSATTFTSPHHLLKATTVASATRHHLRKQKQKQQQQQQISLPLSPGSDYTLTFTLNSQTLSVYMDTGSDVVWFPCSPFECILCDDKYPPGTLKLLHVTNSSLLSCKSRACSSAHSSLPSSDLCAIAACPLADIETSDCRNFACPPFYYAYGDGSLIAQLHKHDLTMPSNSKTPLMLKNFTFGCSNTALGEPIGVAGFGRGPLSLPAQLADMSPELGNQFSYCLVSHSFDSDKLRHPSPLILGKHKQKVDFSQNEVMTSLPSFVYTPMLDNPKHPYFYSVGLDAISVGSRRIDSPKNLKRVDHNGDGGVVVDSGTTYTMMPTGFYNSVASELDRRVGKVFKRTKETELRTGLSPCYELDTRKGSVGLVVPSMVLHFGGNGDNSSVVLPRRNYFYEFVDGGDEGKKGKKVGCLMMMNGGDDGETGSGPGLTLGNYQQQGFEVVYDLEEMRVGFARRKCASLWEDLNRH